MYKLTVRQTEFQGTMAWISMTEEGLTLAELIGKLESLNLFTLRLRYSDSVNQDDRNTIEDRLFD